MQARLTVALPLVETYSPGWQVVYDAQRAAFAVTPKVPLAHPTHVRSASLVPSVKTLCPGTHDVKAMQTVAALPSSSQVPFGQGTGGAAPPRQYVPGSQRSHIASAVGVAGASCRVPAGHAPSGKHELWFGEVDMVPTAQGVHCRSLVDVPAWFTYEPGAHEVHSAHDSESMLALKVPLSHAMQLRSERGVTATKTRSPARPCVASAQGVAGSLSWSHVDPEHVSFGRPAPGQYSPGAHASQSEGDPPGRSTVPAAHVPFGVHAAWFADVDLKLPRFCGHPAESDSRARDQSWVSKNDESLRLNLRPIV